MVFSSLLFLYVYLPSVLLIYFILPKKFRNFALLTVSLLFYGWGEPIYVLLMVFSTIQDYICSLMIEKNRDDPKRKRRYLTISIVGNLCVLGVFKYLDFIIINLSHIPPLSGLRPVGLALPIGISFYTFQTMSYTIDVYFGVNKAQKSIINLGTFVTMFPQVTAGPIVKYKDVSAELNDRKHTFDSFAEGIMQFTVGLCKKVLIANSVGALFDKYSLTDVSSMTAAGAWLSAIAFTFQIYFDFSGYSDMAIGIGKMLAFRFLPNFNYPYTAESITDFWRRWHMSLSSWFREYLYLPLGGNRKGRVRTIVNLFVVWMATGIWHGASWNYVLWGLYYFVVLSAEKMFMLKILAKVPRFVRNAYTVLLVILGWVLFSNENLSRCVGMVGTMFGAGAIWAPADIFYLRGYIIVFIIAAIGSGPLIKNLFYRLSGRAREYAKVILVISGLFLCTASLVDSTYNPFLYFRF